MGGQEASGPDSKFCSFKTLARTEFAHLVWSLTKGCLKVLSPDGDKKLGLPCKSPHLLLYSPLLFCFIIAFLCGFCFCVNMDLDLDNVVVFVLLLEVGMDYSNE